jgi:hypothetical protein
MGHGRRRLRPRTLHPAERAHGCPSVLWNRRIRALEPKKERRSQVPASARRGCLYKMSGTGLSGGALPSARSRGPRLARAAARLPRCEKHKPKGSVSMTTASGPTGRSHLRRSHGAQAPTPSTKHCLNATVRAADDLDDWIRRYVIEHPLRYRVRYRASESCVDQSQSAKGQKPVPPFSRVSASHTADQSQMNQPLRNRTVFVRDRSVWLSLGHCLRVQYDALAAPVPPHIAALVEQLDSQK